MLGFDLVPESKLELSKILYLLIKSIQQIVFLVIKDGKIIVNNDFFYFLSKGIE